MDRRSYLPGSADVEHVGNEPGVPVLMIAPQPFFENRGTPIAIRNVLEALSAGGLAVDLLTYPVGENVELKGLRIHRAGSTLPIRSVPIGFSMRKVLLDAFLAPWILWLARRNRYRFIYAVEEAAYLALLLRPWHGLSVIYDMQSSLPEQLNGHSFFQLPILQKILLFCERWAIRNSDCILCSAGLRQYVLRIDPGAKVDEWIFPGKHHEVSIQEGRDLRNKLDIASGANVVLYTGNFEVYQGLARLIESVTRVVSEVPGTVFLFVGDDGNANFPFRERTDDLVRSGALRLVPRQAQAEIGRYLSIADVVVSPRDDVNNVGIKIFEYLASGKPIVATDTPAHRTVLSEERAVLVGLSPEEMAKAIVILLRDRDLAERLGTAARMYAEEHLNVESFSRRVGTMLDLCGR